MRREVLIEPVAVLGRLARGPLGVLPLGGGEDGDVPMVRESRDDGVEIVDFVGGVGVEEDGALGGGLGGGGLALRGRRGQGC